MYSKEDEDFIEQRSRENLAETYREELNIIEDHKCVDFIPLSVGGR